MPTPPLPDSVLLEAVEALRSVGTVIGAARSLGLDRGTFKNRLIRAAQRGIVPIEQQLEVKQGWSPAHGLDQVVPQPLVLRGTSTLYKDGVQKLQWVKTKLDDSKVEAAMLAAIARLSATMPRAEPTNPPNHTSEALCNLYTFTDCHVGMYSWAAETGDDWDLGITERMLTGAFDYLVDAAPPAETAVVLNLGDFMHFDSLAAVTPTNGHLLDADSRYSKVVGVAVGILRHIVTRALEKHRRVVVVMAEGNHDPASSVWLRHLFRLLYENEPRVTVINNETPYVMHQHGETMLAFHHGHLSKKEQLPLLFAASYPKEWGATTKRYCHTGHCHHVDEKEYSGMKVKQHATLAARDAYAARGGWVANRQIEAVTYHSRFGQVATTTVVPEMLELDRSVSS